MFYDLPSFRKSLFGRNWADSFEHEDPNDNSDSESYRCVHFLGKKMKVLQALLLYDELSILSETAQIRA